MTAREKLDANALQRAANAVTSAHNRATGRVLLGDFAEELARAAVTRYLAGIFADGWILCATREAAEFQAKPSGALFQPLYAEGAWGDAVPGDRVYDAWTEIGRDSRLQRALEKLSIHEIRLIVGHAQGRSAAEQRS